VVILLGIESATETVGAAVDDGQGGRASMSIAGRRRHAENLAPAIEAVLERAGVSLREVGAVALDVGPGLFTGLRVGVATAKGLAQGLGVGVLGVTSLEVLAAAAIDESWDGPVVPVADGRRGEVFAARYARGARPGELIEEVAPGRHRPEDLGAMVGSRGGPPGLACGDGALRYRGLLEAAGLRVAGARLGAPDPAVLVSLAAARLAAGAEAVPAVAVEPVYLREADVRINWVQRTRATSGR